MSLFLIIAHYYTCSCCDWYDLYIGTSLPPTNIFRVECTSMNEETKMVTTVEDIVLDIIIGKLKHIGSIISILEYGMKDQGI